jgi:hypothetical protein
MFYAAKQLPYLYRSDQGMVQQLPLLEGPGIFPRDTLHVKVLIEHTLGRADELLSCQ